MRILNLTSIVGGSEFVIGLTVIGDAEGVLVGLLTGLLVGGTDLGMGPDVGLGIFGDSWLSGSPRAHRWDY